MKNEYEPLEMEIISFGCEDVIVTSTTQPGGGDEGGGKGIPDQYFNGQG